MEEKEKKEEEKNDIYGFIAPSANKPPDATSVISAGALVSDSIVLTYIVKPSAA